MSLLSAAALATLIFCAPGYPGAASDAQPLLDQFASAAASAAGWPPGSLTAVYDPTESGGLAKLANPDASLAFVPYPFFVEHATELHLTPLVQADVVDVGTEERWTLVAKSGQVQGPQSLAGFTLVSVAGYAPDFVRHSALAAWPLPPDVKIESTGLILSALRRVASGEHTVALLDQTQTTALPSLPFASELQSVTQSPSLPVAFVVTVGSRLPAERAQSLRAGLLKMRQTSPEALASLKLRGFVPPTLPHAAAP